MYLCLYNRYRSSYCSSGRRAETTSKTNHRPGGTKCYLEQANDTMKHAIEKLEVEAVQQRSTNMALQGHLDNLRATVTKNTAPLNSRWEKAVGSLNTKLFSNICCNDHLCLCFKNPEVVNTLLDSTMLTNFILNSKRKMFWFFCKFNWSVHGIYYKSHSSAKGGVGV